MYEADIGGIPTVGASSLHIIFDKGDEKRASSKGKIRQYYNDELVVMPLNYSVMDRQLACDNLQKTTSHGYWIWIVYTSENWFQIYRSTDCR